MRSRARSFPRAVCFARASSLPPCVAASSLARRSATSPFITSALRATSGELGSTAERRTAILSPVGLPCFFEKLAAYQHAPDLAGASSDLIELRIAQVAAGGIFIDVAVAAQELYRIEREPGCIL